MYIHYNVIFTYHTFILINSVIFILSAVDKIELIIKLIVHVLIFILTQTYLSYNVMLIMEFIAHALNIY